MKRALVLVAVAVAVAVAACSKASPSPAPTPRPSPAPTPSPTPSPSPTETSTLELLDPGHVPRRVLRYRHRADRREALALELRTTTSLESGGAHQEIPLPPLKVVVAIDPRSVSPDGALRFAWHVTSASSEPEPDAAQPMAEQWVAQLAPVEHLTGTGVVDSRGLARDVEVDPASAGDAGPNAQAAGEGPRGDNEMVVQVVQVLRDEMAAPLPEEAVGQGARWQKLSTLDVAGEGPRDSNGTKGGHVVQTDTYTLTDLHGDEGSLDDVLAQTASSQALPSPLGAPSPEPARLDSLLLSATAKTRFDLSRVVAQTTLEGTTSLTLSAGGRPLSMTMRLGISVEGSLR